VGEDSVKFFAMTKLRFLLLFLLLALAGTPAPAALFGGEKKSFDAASESFRWEMWERAEKEFAEFVRDHPQSEKLAEALLWQAQAQYRQGKYAALVELLTPRQAQAGGWADHYLYWIATAQFAGTNYAAAATNFGKLAREFPQSPKRLEAAVNEAASFAKLGNWTNVVDLLTRSNGPFRLAAQAGPGSEMVARGFLLQAEGQLELQDYPAAEVSLKKIASGLTGELEWQRQFLLCRTLVALKRADEAVEVSAGMITAAEKTLQIGLISDSVVFRADLLAQLGRWDEAITTLQKNLTNAPVARQRQALVRITALALQQNKLVEATQTLESYLTRFTNSTAADVAWLTLGEIHLKQHVGRLPGIGTNGIVTNHLAAAMSCFQRVLQRFPESAYVGKAQLNLGWSYWVERKFPESATAFDAAVKRLPLSEDLVVARFKLADAQFAQNNFPEALANYREVLQLATNWPAVNAALRTPASYQALRASLALTNAAGAEQAMRSILAEAAPSPEAMSSVLLVAQAYVDASQPLEAQRLFGEFALKFPQSDLQPEVELLVARMREEQGDWTKVSAAYDAWLGRYATNRLRVQVEFQRALAAAGAGEDLDALRRFTNFVARYPTNDLAPRAQWWVADYHFGREEWVAAELNYKLVFQNWKTSDLAYEARMMAGRAAVRRTDYPVAIEHFISLTSDTNCPVGLRAQALFARGGALMLSAPASTNKLEKWEEARQIFGVVLQLYPTNEMTAAAWGELGNCSLQMATTDPAYYHAASNAYYQALTFPAATGEVRSLAKLGLATVLEKQALLAAGEEQANLLKQARDHVLDVYSPVKLRRDDEMPNLFSRRKAGLEAARLSEVLNEWQPAIQLYRDLQREKLLSAEAAEKKISNAERQLQPVEKND
jgi:TolA-binding protein